MAWVHEYCGTVYDQRRQPTYCEFCRKLLVRVMGDRKDSWRQVGTPKNKKRVVRGSTAPIGHAQRHRIYRRDGFRCVRCGEIRFSELSIDHRIPRSRGGRNDDANLQTMCKTCNVQKADKLPDEC